MITFQTNYASMVSQNNLNSNNAFQTQTIQALTSGFRINNSGDDPAGLAVANNYRNQISQLTQGVQNANNGVSTLQIVDGGLNNISTMLDRLQTLASESATTTFTGDRNNINVEYQQLVQEISQQATTIGLNNGGSFNTQNQIFIGGGGSNLSNSQVSVDLSGISNTVDAAGLGLSTTSVAAGGAELTGGTPNIVRLDAPGAVFLKGSGNQSFSFNLISNNSATTFTASLAGGAAGLTEAQVVSSLNSQLSAHGITSQVGADGQIQFGGATPFTVSTGVASAGGAVATAASTAKNVGVYNADGAASYTAAAETLTFQNGQGTANVTLTAADTLGSAIAAINSQTSTIGVYAVANAAGTGISFQSANSFTSSTNAAAAGAFAVTGVQTVNAPSSTASTTGNALAAVTAIQTALSQLGQVQARVGAGENKLQYAIDLANSQITNVSSAESQIRDANVALEAANLTKAQVLQQASVAAMAQANSAPQSILKLLQ